MQGCKTKLFMCLHFSQTGSGPAVRQTDAQQNTCSSIIRVINGMLRLAAPGSIKTPLGISSLTSESSSEKIQADTVNLSTDSDLSMCGQQIPSGSVNLFEEYLTEMYGLCWVLKTVPRSEIFLEEASVPNCQVLHLTHGSVDASLCTK